LSPTETYRVPADPLHGLGIAGFGRRFRSGEMSSEALVQTYLQRIAALDGKLQAFEYVGGEQALTEARDIDRKIRAGVDLGPLMGLPVAVKDIIAVEGMPTGAGSNVDVRDIVGDEGPFIASLKRAGCVMLGKTKTPEFARSGVGINLVRGTPWNPWDSRVRRVAGGSSSGSAVAVAAGLCAFAIGTDTSGSVRVPAAFCGVFGFKPTRGLWSNDGIFPLSPTLDTIGFLTASAADAALVFATIEKRPVPEPVSLRKLRLGLPSNHFFDALSPAVDKAMTATLSRLGGEGVDFVTVELPGVEARDQRFRPMVSAELIAVLGRERFVAARGTMDSDVWQRTASGLEVMADEYARLLWRHQHLSQVVGQQMMAGLDGWVVPTSHLTAEPVSDLINTPVGLQYTADVGRNTWPASIYGNCATSSPLPVTNGSLPVGLQIVCAGSHEAGLLSIARALEELQGVPTVPDVSPFLG
jgi:aspartyl-tRNA(Asn)/glutamyl-tRNA(Gln) amidotransferase subunit A